jgi:hypothetical protein
VAVLGGLAIVAVVAGILVLHGSWSGQVQDHPSCGHVVNSVNNYNAQVPGCLWHAYQAQETATGIMVNFTVEGDPITYTVTVRPTTIDVGIQSQDRYGSRGFFAYTCGGLSQKPALADARHIYLVATGCRGPQGFVDDNGAITIP